MKLLSKISLFVISIFFMLILFTSCSSKGDFKEITFYSDSDSYENDKIKLELDSISCSGYTDYSLSIYFNIKNKEYETNTYIVKDVKLIKEDTSAKYRVVYSDSRTLDAEMSGKLYFYADIPSDIKNENYKLTFTINSYKLTLYIYQKPDELREEYNVDYYILDNLVHSTKVLEGENVDPYIYESKDNLYYCQSWCFEDDIALTNSTKIRSNTRLNGVLTPNFAINASNQYATVSGVNHIPTSGILILSNEYTDKEFVISYKAINGISVSEIYIPKTVHEIEAQNFTNLGQAKIYYEGTEEEWKALFKYSYSIVTYNVIYNTKVPYFVYI